MKSVLNERSSASRRPKNGILAAVALVAMASASSAALADCNGTGSFVPGAVPGFNPSAILPFAAGGAVNSLVSAINTANTAFLTQSTAFVSAPANPQPKSGRRRRLDERHRRGNYNQEHQHDVECCRGWLRFAGDSHL